MLVNYYFIIHFNEYLNIRIIRWPSIKDITRATHERNLSILFKLIGRPFKKENMYWDHKFTF